MDSKDFDAYQAQIQAYVEDIVSRLPQLVAADVEYGERGSITLDYPVDVNGAALYAAAARVEAVYSGTGIFSSVSAHEKHKGLFKNKVVGYEVWAVVADMQGLKELRNHG